MEEWPWSQIWQACISLQFPEWDLDWRWKFRSEYPCRYLQCVKKLMTFFCPLCLTFWQVLPTCSDLPITMLDIPNYVLMKILGMEVAGCTFLQNMLALPAYSAYHLYLVAHESVATTLHINTTVCFLLWYSFSTITYLVFFSTAQLLMGGIHCQNS